MRVEGVAVLAHERDAVTLVDGHDPDGHIGEMDDAVDSGLSVRPA